MFVQGYRANNKKSWRKRQKKKRKNELINSASPLNLTNIFPTTSFSFSLKRWILAYI